MNHDVGKLNKCREISKFRREALHFKKHPRVAKEMCLSSSISVLMHIHLYIYILSWAKPDILECSAQIAWVVSVPCTCKVNCKSEVCNFSFSSGQYASVTEGMGRNFEAGQLNLQLGCLSPLTLCAGMLWARNSDNILPNPSKLKAQQMQLLCITYPLVYVQPGKCSAGLMWNQNVQRASENSAISQRLGEN